MLEGKDHGKELMLSILRSKAEDSASMLAEVGSPRIEPSEFEPTTAKQIHQRSI